MKTKKIILIIAVILIVSVIIYFESTKPEVGKISRDTEIKIQETSNLADSGRIAIKAEKYERAKELVNPEGYINIDNITIAENLGKKVILIDFWTYSCINCQRTLPYLTTWYDKYEDDGLLIIGIHTPEFDFEKDYDNVKSAVEKWNINYPVVQDNDYQTWRAYNNRYWPRKYIIDIDGFIVYDHIGEGAYEETEELIQELLKERSIVLNITSEVEEEISVVKADKPESGKINTPEIYFGYDFSRNQMGNNEGWSPDEVVTYAFPEKIYPNKFYLLGEWKNNKDNMEAISEESVVKIKYDAKIINIVAGSSEPKEITVIVDGVETKKIEVSDFDLYELNREDDYAEHTLELKVSKGVMLYTFTFG
ncbi:thiol-disulfide isomerase [Candidatus Woesearchaeota archaeon CG10_big_fil_rev_8_21_14_0_10_34_8]|nr:MAG: thiol-disulfide isomerase [Candidatus Woesearchaeota archaeon CG10_big_fil_rev_8_21_14_0_10_34_8]